MMNEEEIIFNLIKKSCEEGGSALEEKVFRSAMLLNINSERYEKIKAKLIESGKISNDGTKFFVL